MSALSATRAMLAALSAGAPLADALQIASRMSRGRIAPEVESIEQQPLEPKVVSILLARSAPGSLREVADLARRALAARREHVRFFPHPPAVLATALIVLLVGGIARIFLAKVPPLGIDLALITNGQIAAGLGLALALAGFLLRKDRGTWSDLRSLFDPRLPALTADRAILWLAAGEAAGVPPAIVAAALYRSVSIGRAPDLDGAVARILQAAGLNALLPLAGAAFSGEAGPRAAARIARLASIAARPPRDGWRWLSYFSMVLVVVAAFCVAGAIHVGISRMGAFQW